MNLLKNERSRTLIISLLSSLVLTLLIAAGGVLDRVDLWAQDSWFQSDKALDGEIIVIGIDDASLDELGPYNTWDRTYMAAALEKLAEDPEMKPAVVAIDTLYIEESTPEADERLANAAEQLGNVVTASFATIGSKVITEDGNTYFATDAVLAYEEPYDALRDATTQGHINAMYDTDGILRHALLYVKPEGTTVYSMAYETARLYGEYNGFEIQMPPASSGGHYYVTYSAGPKGYYDGYSFSDLINGRIDPQDYAGKVVFIGPYAKGLQDEYFTTIERSKLMYGVEYQANVVQMILESNYKTEVSRFPQALVLFIVCFLMFLLFQKVGIKLSTVIAAAAAVLSIGIEYALFNVKIGGVGHVLHPLWLPVGILVFYIASIVIHYVKSTLEKRRVTRTFERYVAPEIVSEILKGGTEALSLGGKTVDIAVLFVDVRGFTTMSERLDPEKVVFIGPYAKGLQDEYFTTIERSKLMYGVEYQA
ncbi:MAG: CHASE2 domain-containing protein, partial [Lachnospiraceae bacterium]|nr:CHASE2 domain-containing protein [Lachnospiraceae bacterium]